MIDAMILYMILYIEQGGFIFMFEVKLKKQAAKYYNKCTGKAFTKIDNA